MAEPRTLARPYARAAFDHAHQAGKTAAWQDALSIAAGVAAEAGVAESLSDPAKTAAQRAALLSDLLGDALPADVANFVTIMAENDRLPLLAEIAALFAELKAAAEASIAVSVTSAFDVSTQELDQISAAMSRRFERTVSIASETDPALIGGAIIRAGDVVIDGSVRGRLNKLAGTLTPR